MKLKSNVNAAEFLREVELCRGEVFLETPEDQLNLKSKLSQYVFVVIEGNDELRDSAQVRCVAPEDYAVLQSYLEA